MVPMARILVVGVVFIAAPCAFAELKPTRQPITANAAAETNFMLSPLCLLLRRPGEPIGIASPVSQPYINFVLLDGLPPSFWRSRVNLSHSASFESFDRNAPS